MNIDWATIVSSTWRVAAAGVLLGAGLPLLFAIAVRLQAIGAGHSREATDAAGAGDRGVGDAGATSLRGDRNPAATAASYAIFAVIALIVVYAVLFITAKSLHHYFGFNLPGYSS